MTTTSRFLGAQDLGLEVRWRFRFVGLGERVAATPDVLYLDVGGGLEPGVVDHHAEVGGHTSTAMLLLTHRELAYTHLLGPWLERQRSGPILPGTVWAPTVVLHHGPDFDAAVATHLTMHLVEHGDFPAHARALAAYSEQVDQGRYALQPDAPAALDAVHLAYLALQNVVGASGRGPSSEVQLARGLELLERALAGITAARQGRPANRVEDLLPGAPGVGAWRQDPAFADLVRLLDEERLAFAADLAEADLREAVPLPAVDGGEAIPVRAFIAPGPTRSVLNKYWVRAAGFPFFICPQGAPRAPGTVILSLDPNFAHDGRRPTLRGLGFALEQAEAEARRALHGGRGDREGPPRFGDGYCDNADPWYDGRGHEWTIVDSPRSGSVLPLEQVVETATGGRFWKARLLEAAVHVVCCDPAEPPQGVSPGLPPFPGMAGTLRPLYEELAESRPRPCPGLELSDTGDDRFRVTERVRFPPDGTCDPLTIIEIRAEEGACLEDLLEVRRRLLGAREPDFSVARVRLASHHGPPAWVDRLLRELGGPDMIPLAQLSDEGDLVLFNSRSVVLRQARPAAASEGRDPDVEIVLYAAFLYFTLLSFSERLSDLVPPGGARLEPGSTTPLREDFLRFQARYWQLEVSRAARGRTLFGHLSEALDLAGHYAEVQVELDRLAELESQLAEERKAKAERVMEATLFFLAVAGLFQTVLAFLTWPDLDPSMWWTWVGPVLAVAAGIYLWYLKVSRSG